MPSGLLPFEWLLIAGLFAFNAVVSAAEIAMASLSRGKLSELSEEHPGFERVLSLWKEHPSQLLTTILVSSNLAVVGLSTVAALMAVQMNAGLNWSPWVVSILSALASLLVVLFSEIAPKLAAKRRPERIALLTLPLLNLLEAALGPMIRRLVGLIGWATGPFGGGQADGLPTVTEEELVHMVDEGTRSGTLEPEESAMIQSVIAFGDTVVREVMVPRTRLDGLTIHSTVDECLDKFIDTGYTRLPVYDADFDHIVGLVYAKDFLAVLKERNLIILQDVLRPAYFVPESKKVSELLREFRKGRIHLAVVVDEYGGTAGIVTLEDLVEEIIGEIRDEYDTETGPVRPRGPGVWEVDAEAGLHDFGAEIAVEFPQEGEATSVGGFVAEHLGRIPQKGAHLEWESLDFEVLESSDRQVHRVLVRRRAPKPGTP
ncbi:MAG TPA: hemolysin family protein [bacterium]|nr:hemolysin family protein [bacterium]